MIETSFQSLQEYPKPSISRMPVFSIWGFQSLQEYPKRIKVEVSPPGNLVSNPYRNILSASIGLNLNGGYSLFPILTGIS